LAAHALGSGNSDDLIAAIAKASGKGETLARALRSFLDQPGIPLVRTRLSCVGGKASLDVGQSRYLPYGALSNDTLRWSVPLCVRFGHGDKSDRQCFLADKPKQAFVVAGGCADWYLPNADAAGYYRFSMPEADLAALNRHVAALSRSEQMIYADALKSAFRSGEIGPAPL